MIIRIKKLDPSLPTPQYAHLWDAGLDLYSRIETELRPGERALIPTGIAISLPPEYAGFVQPRSGLAIKEGIGVLNSPGLIDAGYRGEISVILINLDKERSFKIRKGDKICQLVIQQVIQAEIKVVDELDATERGEGGFGSTGA